MTVLPPATDSIFHCVHPAFMREDSAKYYKAHQPSVWQGCCAHSPDWTFYVRRRQLMTRLKICTGVCTALFLMVALVSGTAVAQDAKVQDSKSEDAKIVEGTLMDIDPITKVLTLKAGDDQMQFSVTDQTELVAAGNDGKPPVVEQGTKLRVHYSEREKAKIATKIEIIEAAAAR